jgi:DNA-binding MarR family transcriptional regulator
MTANDAEPRWLDDDQQRAWRAFVSMYTRLDAHLGRDLQATTDLSTADFSVLVALTDVCQGRVRAYELSEALEWEKSRLSHHLGRMAKRGLITRGGCSEDGRGQFVAVTPAGRAAIEAAAPHHVETVRRLVFDVLSAEEVAALAAISQAVLARLDAERNPCDAPGDPCDPIPKGPRGIGPGGSNL